MVERLHDHALVAELRALGGPLREDRSPEDRTAELTETVMTRVHAEAVPMRRRARWGRDRPWTHERPGSRGRWRPLVAAATGLLLALLLVPPVRATVVEWFAFAGIVVREAPGPAPPSAPPPPTAGADREFAEARRLVGFEPLVPEALGAPDGVEVSPDHQVLSMTWEGDGPGGASETDSADGTVRLDQFDGRLDREFMKRVFESAEWVSVAGSEALWFAQPHEIVVLGEEGRESTVPPRLAGSTLVWQQAGTTLRLEGDFDRKRALEIAESATER